MSLGWSLIPYVLNLQCIFNVLSNPLPQIHNLLVHFAFLNLESAEAWQSSGKVPYLKRAISQDAQIRRVPL